MFAENTLGYILHPKKTVFNESSGRKSTPYFHRVFGPPLKNEATL